MFAKLKNLFSKPKPEIPVTPAPEPYKGPPSAGAYLLPAHIVVFAYGRLPGGLHLSCEPCIVNPLSASDESIGEAVVQGLDAFRADIPFPEDHGAARKRQLRAMKVRSERELQKTALSCSLCRKVDGFEFEPTHNGGTAGDERGFAPNGTKFKIPLSSTKAELGAALKRAFSLCTTVNQGAENK